MQPDFLCIGASKSGTTWLDYQLRAHPEVWLPPVKELHHFDCATQLPWGAYFPFDPAIQFNLRRIARQGVTDLVAGKGNMLWYLRYFLGRRTDHWYRSLFEAETHQIAGEVTPGYARLNRERVAHIHSLMPNLKVIYLLRNPIERMWSQAAMYFSKYGHAGLANISDEEIFRFLEHPDHKRNSEYTKTLDIWHEFYPAEQIFVGFFEEIKIQPLQLLNRLFAFLDLDTSVEYIAAPFDDRANGRADNRVSHRINHRDYPEMPEHFKQILAQSFRTEITHLHERFDNATTAQWKIALDTMLQDNLSSSSNQAEQS